jgi:hypothetical protein
MSTTDKEDAEGGEYIQEDAGDTTYLCCGICDMRIATIFANAFNIAMTLVGVLAMGFRDNLFWKAMGAAFAMGLPGLVLSGVGLYGAKTFELWAMYLACGGFAVILLVDAILWQWVGFVVTTIVLFPHAALTLEMRNGVITKENYAEQTFVSPEGMEFVNRAHAYIAPVPVTTTTA